MASRSPSRRRHVVSPDGSIFLTETFIFSLIVIAAAILLPIYLVGSWRSPIPGKPDETLLKAGQAFVKSAKNAIPDHIPSPEELAAATPRIPSPEALAAATPRVQPYLKRLPNLSPYILKVLGYTKPLFVDLPYTIGRYILLAIFLPISYLFNVLVAILAPVWVLLEVTFDVFIRAPFNAVSWLAGLLYPVYVFCGVAALVGALLGLVGVGIGNVGLYFAGSNAEGRQVGDTGHTDTRERSSKGKGRETSIEMMGTEYGRNETTATIKVEEDSRRGRRVGFDPALERVRYPGRTSEGGT